MGRNAQKHAQACTDALVASHHQPRNLTLLEPISVLGNSWLARSTIRSCTELTLKQFSDNPRGRRTTVARTPASNVPKPREYAAPQRNRVTVAFFGQECTKTQEICSVHSETVRQLPLFEPRFGPKYKSDPRKSEILLYSARSAATCLFRSLR